MGKTQVIACIDWAKTTGKTDVLVTIKDVSCTVRTSGSNILQKFKTLEILSWAKCFSLRWQLFSVNSCLWRALQNRFSKEVMVIKCLYKSYAKSAQDFAWSLWRSWTYDYENWHNTVIGEMEDCVTLVRILFEFFGICRHLNYLKEVCSILALFETPSDHFKFKKSFY